MIKKIVKNNKGYNGCCTICDKYQPGCAKQPLLVYYRDDNEKRGHYLVACSQECANKLIKKII